MVGEDTGRPSGRRYGSTSEASSYNDSHQGTLRPNNGGGATERDSLLHHDELDGGGGLRHQGLTKLNLGSIKGGRDVIKLTDGYQNKHLKRYDDKSAALFDEQDTFLDKNTSAEETSKALMKKNSWLKKLYRTVLFVIIVGFLLFLNFILDKAADVSKEYLISNVSDPLRLVLPKCYIYLVNEGPASGIKLSLKTIELIFTPNIIFERKRVVERLTSNSNEHTLYLYHEDEDYACSVTVSWPAEQELSSLEVECQYCTIIARDPVKIGQLTVKGNGVYSNFQKLEVSTITYSTVSGMAEMHEFNLKGNAYFNVTNGTVMVQSRTDFKVNLMNGNDLYCLSAPTVSANTIACTEENLTDDILKNLYNITSYTKCIGSANLCKETSCSPAVTLSFETLVGSLYANILTREKSYVVDDSNSVAAGSRYFKNISLNPSDQEQLLQILKNSDSITSLPLILRVDVGNFKGISSSATRYMVTEYPLTSVYDPWTVAGLTMGIFTSNYQEVSVFLSPGFCPYRPSISRKQ